MATSVELKNIVLNLYVCITKGQITAVDNIFSSEVGILLIGSDPTERWTDYDTIVRAFKMQLQGIGAQQFHAGDIEVVVEGSVGWAYERHTAKPG